MEGAQFGVCVNVNRGVYHPSGGVNNSLNVADRTTSDTRKLNTIRPTVGMKAYVALPVADRYHLVCHCFLMCLATNLLHEGKVMEPLTIYNLVVESKCLLSSHVSMFIITNTSVTRNPHY